MIDPSIALSYQPTVPPPNLGQIAGDANALLQFRQNQQAMQRQNALQQVLSTPGAIDATGDPTPDTLTKITSIDPALGIKFRENYLATQQKLLQIEGLKTQQAFATASSLSNAYTPILEQYEDNIKNGMPPAAALREAQDATTQTTEQLKNGGMLSSNVASNLPTQFDPQDFRRRALLSKQYMDWWKAQRDAAKAGEQVMVDSAGRPFVLRPGMPPGQNANYLDGTPVPQAAMQGTRKAGGQEYSNPQTVQLPDGKTVLAQQEKSTGQWFTADQARTPLPAGVMPVKVPVPGSEAAVRAAVADDIAHDPVTKDLSKGQQAEELERQLAVAKAGMSPEAMKAYADGIAEYKFPPLTGYAVTHGAGPQINGMVLKANPDYEATEYNNYNKTVSAFGAGKQGDVIRFMNNAVQHIDVMQEAGDRLDNGGIRAVNGVVQYLNKELGYSAPTTYDGLRQIVGTEIERAATGGVGAAVDRDRLIESLNKANSPEQMVDVFRRYHELFRGQAMSLKNQYEQGTPNVPAFRTGQFDFDRFLLPETKKALGWSEIEEKGAGPSAPAAQPAAAPAESLPHPQSKADYDKLDPGARYVAQDGSVKVKGGAAPAAPATPAQPQVQQGSPQPAAASTQPQAAQAAPSAAPVQPSLKPLPPDIRAKAEDAIKRGAPRDAVIKRLRDSGIDPTGL